jgi:predicted DNA-binding transcriptional regulator AlpA
LVSLPASNEEAEVAPHKLTKKELAEQRAHRAAKREASTQYDNPRQVMTLDQVARLDGTSKPTLLRQIAAGTGPKTIRLSTRRVGVTVGDYDAWQRVRKGAVS